MTAGWTNISGPVPVSVLSRSSIYYSMLLLHNHIRQLNDISTVFLENLLHFLLRGDKRLETAATQKLEFQKPQNLIKMLRKSPVSNT